MLLAGDAAHIHAPLGGQGLNTGVQDAVNLGWKLARVVKGESPDFLLDTYHAERHPVGARVLDNTMAQTALVVADDRHKALHAAVARWLALDEPRKEVSAMISGLDIRYDTHDEVGGDHPLVGRRMPDLDVHTAEGPTRVFALLHTARPVLLNLGAVVGFDVSSWPGVRMVDARYDGPWELPVIGQVAAPTSSADPPRRLRRLDRRPHRLRPAASPDHMVQSARLTTRGSWARRGHADMCGSAWWPSSSFGPSRLRCLIVGCACYGQRTNGGLGGNGDPTCRIAAIASTLPQTLFRGRRLSAPGLDVLGAR